MTLALSHRANSNTYGVNRENFSISHFPQFRFAKSIFIHHSLFNIPSSVRYSSVHSKFACSIFDIHSLFNRIDIHGDPDTPHAFGFDPVIAIKDPVDQVFNRFCFLVRLDFQLGLPLKKAVHLFDNAG